MPDIFERCFRNIAVLTLPLLSVVACDSSQQTVRLNGGGMSIPLPENLRQVASLSDDQLEIQISVNGNVIRTRPVGDNEETITTVVNIPAEQNNEITIAWFAVVGSQNVLLADITEVVPAGTPELNVANYNSTGSRFDADGDDLNNLEEALENRNLLSEFDLDVPQVNGFGGTVAYITDNGVDSNASGDAPEPDEDTLFRLRHNGTELVVYVCGQDRTLIGDSFTDNGEFWHDDTVFIYLDGNDSDSGDYDQVDDFQLAFVRSTEEMIVPNGKGASNQFCANGACVSHQFFNNVSSCEYELNVFLPLNEMNMALDSAIGFDIEIVDDDNGNLRDASSTWIGFDDRSDLDTRSFGTIRLN